MKAQQIQAQFIKKREIQQKNQEKTNGIQKKINFPGTKNKQIFEFQLCTHIMPDLLG